MRYEDDSSALRNVNLIIHGDELISLLLFVADDTPCRFDHHGYCQEHLGVDDDGICVNARIVNLLEMFGIERLNLGQ